MPAQVDALSVYYEPQQGGWLVCNDDGYGYNININHWGWQWIQAGECFGPFAAEPSVQVG